MSARPERHGGPDALGVPAWDFSTNANACGPAPAAWCAVQAADASRYPDPGYGALKALLAAHHGVPPTRLVLAVSASEFIVRLSVALALARPGATVRVPCPGYGDYGAAARAAGLKVVSDEAAASAGPPAALVWHTEPGSPRGRSEPLPACPGALQVIDCAYAPLRLAGTPLPVPAEAWTLWSPNKALGLTGVRGAYAVLPEGAPHAAWRVRLEALAPSWPLGAHAVAMLTAWPCAETQHWLQASHAVLRRWKAQQTALCTELGWDVEASDTPFFVARWPAGAPAPATLLPRLRARGVKLRDAGPLGLPGAVRLGVQPPAAQRALAAAWRAVQDTSTTMRDTTR